MSGPILVPVSESVAYLCIFASWVVKDVIGQKGSGLDILSSCIQLYLPLDSLSTSPWGFLGKVTVCCLKCASMSSVINVGWRDVGVCVCVMGWWGGLGCPQLQLSAQAMQRLLHQISGEAE